MLIAPFLAALVLLKPPMVITPDIHDGDVISREKVIKVRVQSDALVTQVEMYVADDLRDSQTATPYTFRIDPLTEKEGEEKLTFTAYSSEGNKQSKDVHVTIDTGASKGAEANANLALEALTNSQWDDAVLFGRVALKANPDYNPARLTVSRGYLRKGVYDKAQQFAEEFLKKEPTSREGLELMSAIQLQRSFNSVVGATDPISVAEAMGNAIKVAVENRHKVLEAEYDKAPPASGATLLQYADTAFRAMHYSAAINALTPAFDTQDFNHDIGNRLAFAQLKVGRIADGTHTLLLMTKHKTLDAYGLSLAAAVNELKGDTALADQDIKDATAAQPNDPGVRTSKAFVSMHRGDFEAFDKITDTLVSDLGHLPEATFFASVAGDRTHKYDKADKNFRETVLAEPLMYQMYIERGNESLLRLANQPNATEEQKTTYLRLARGMYEAALAAKADSTEALTGVTIINVLDEKIPNSVSFAEAAVKASPDYVPAHYAAANVYASLQHYFSGKADRLRVDPAAESDPQTPSNVRTLQRQADDAWQKAVSEFARAKELDPKRLQGTVTPKIADVVIYFTKYGQLPIVAPPK